MRESLANCVFPIFRKGLETRERLQSGEPINLAQKRKELCQALEALPHQPEFWGEGETFKGIRYALACWLDDLFILDLPPAAEQAADEWGKDAVERKLYLSRLRGVEFWEQETLARQGDPDVLEVFYLCVLLGFRGDKRDKPDELRKWRQSTEGLLRANRLSTWPDRPTELPVRTDVAPLVGRQRLLRAMVILGALLGLLVAVGTFVVVYPWK